MQPGSKPENKFTPPSDVKSVLAMYKKPKKVVVTAGMPYANGPLHVGHLAGAHVPADIYARWMRMLIGAENVLFVNGNDDHGSTSEVAAVKAGKTIREFIDTIHDKQKETLKKYSVQTDVFTGTSRPETYPMHEAYSQDFLRRLFKNGLLEKRTTKQWFDSKMNRFLQDRFVRGTCPNCANTDAYSDECDACGTTWGVFLAAGIFLLVFAAFGGFALLIGLSLIFGYNKVSIYPEFVQSESRLRNSIFGTLKWKESRSEFTLEKSIVLTRDSEGADYTTYRVIYKHATDKKKNIDLYRSYHPDGFDEKFASWKQLLES